MRVGDYVRTKDDLGIQLICKIEKIIDEYCINTDKGYWDITHIIKPSPNIIDLVDYGDVLKIVYDNEEYVCKVVNVLGNKGVKLTTNSSVSLGCLDIKSIITKEQFENMEYRIGE